MAPAKPPGQLVDLENIIAAPIVAVLRANAIAAREAMEFIEKVGFTGSVEPGQDNRLLGDLRVVTFAYGTPPNLRYVSIPLLSLVPIPLLEVKNASFDFGVRLIAALDGPRSPRDRWRTALDAAPGYVRDDRRWRASLATGRPTASAEDQSDLAPHVEANMRIRVAVGQSDIPAGLQKLMAVMGENTPISALHLRFEPACPVFSTPTQPLGFTVVVEGDRPASREPPRVTLLAVSENFQLRTADGLGWSPGESRPIDARHRLHLELVPPAGPLASSPGAPDATHPVTLQFLVETARHNAYGKLHCRFPLSSGVFRVE